MDSHMLLDTQRYKEEKRDKERRIGVNEVFLMKRCPYINTLVCSEYGDHGCTKIETHIASKPNFHMQGFSFSPEGCIKGNKLIYA